MHLMMFYGFGALFIATTLLGINTYSPYKFHKGAYYLLYEATFDSLGLLLLFGLVWAIIRRMRTKEPISQDKWDMGVLWLLLGITINGYFLEAARIAADPHAWDTWSWVGYAMAKPLGSFGPVAYKVAWWFHAIRRSGGHHHRARKCPGRATGRWYPLACSGSTFWRGGLWPGW